MIIKPSSEDIKNMDADSILFECRGCGKAYILVKNLMDDNIKEPKLCTECGAKSFKQMSVFTSKKTILIEDTESKISLLSIKGNLQLLYYDQNNNTLIKEIDIKNYDTILADFAYDIIKTDLKNKYEPEIIREKAIKTVNNLFMTLGRVIRTKNYNGHFYKATNHISTIKEILIQQDTAETEIQKLFKPEEITRINYSDLLTQLQTGKNPINPGEDKNREQTFNEIAKILKTELGLRQELEIKGMEILSDYIYDYYIKTKYNTLEKISEQKLYIHSLKLLHGIDEIPEDMETNFKKTHLKVVLNYIPTSYRHYNILTVGNGLYDMENHEYLSPEDIINRFNEPIITHKSTPYNYNPEAKSKLIKPVLSYAFDPYTIDFNPEIDEIKGFFEVTGYSFTSGNIDQVMCFMFGVPNSAKSLLNKLIVKLHGNRVSSLAVEKFSDRFGKSALVNVQLNSIKDIKNAIIYDNGDYKQVIGDEEIGYEAKGKPFAIIPPLEVPMSIASGNVLPNFENPEPAILRRMLNINFKYRVPTATKVDDNNEVIDWHEDDLNIVKDLKNKRKELGIKLPIPHVQKDLEKKITDNDEEMEWLLHNSLEHERKRIQNNNRIFSIDKSDKKILDDLELYSKPVETLLKDTIIFEDENSHDVGVCTTDLFKLLRAKAKKNFVDLPKTNSSLGKKVKKAIINLFDLDKKYVTVSSRKKLDLNNAVVECDRTRIYPQIKYNVLGLTKKIR